jgi:hypothetical protein
MIEPCEPIYLNNSLCCWTQHAELSIVRLMLKNAVTLTCVDHEESKICFCIHVRIYSIMCRIGLDALNNAAIVLVSYPLY